MEQAGYSGSGGLLPHWEMFMSCRGVFEPLLLQYSCWFCKPASPLCCQSWIQRMRQSQSNTTSSSRLGHKTPQAVNKTGLLPCEAALPLRSSCPESHGQCPYCAQSTIGIALIVHTAPWASPSVFPKHHWHCPRCAHCPMAFTLRVPKAPLALPSLCPDPHGHHLQHGWSLIAIALIVPGAAWESSSLCPEHHGHCPHHA